MSQKAATQRDAFLKNQTFKYWEIFLSWLFKYPSRCYSLSQDSEPQVIENSCDALYRLGKSYRAFAGSKGIICQVTDQPADLDLANATLKAIYHAISDPYLCDLMSAEILAKVMAYRDLREKDRIMIPIRHPSKGIIPVDYQVDTVFDLWNKIRAFGLTSDVRFAAPSFLLFRGTDFSLRSKGGRASIISDLDPKGPGRAVFEKAEPDLQRWLKKQGKQKTRLIGHSLGGAIVLYTLIQEFPWISTAPYARSYAFNAPGISDHLIREWQKIPCSHRPFFQGIISRGDVVSKFGQLFGDTVEISLPTALSPIQAHELLLLAEPLCYMHRIAVDEENRSSSRQFYSKMQQQTSSLIYDIGLKFLLPLP